MTILHQHSDRETDYHPQIAAFDHELLRWPRRRICERFKEIREFPLQDFQQLLVRCSSCSVISGFKILQFTSIVRPNLYAALALTEGCDVHLHPCDRLSCVLARLLQPWWFRFTAEWSPAYPA